MKLYSMYVLTFNLLTLLKEDAAGEDIFFISSGKVFILHKKTMSFIKELIKDDYFGEIAFFSDMMRQATIKSRDYTDLLILSRGAFLKLAASDINALVININI
jgi:CRP-like cAMP-binding protein